MFGENNIGKTIRDNCIMNTIIPYRGTIKLLKKEILVKLGD